MARQFRMNSLDIYRKLSIKSPKSPSKRSQNHSIVLPESENLTIGEGFYITEARTSRTRSADVVKRSETYLVNFSKQLPRPEFNSKGPDVHENRFISYNDRPPCSSRHKPIVSPLFSNCLGRKPQNSFKTPEEYSPNYSSIKKDTKKGLVPFNKTLGRINLTKPPANTQKEVRIDFSKLDPHISSPSIEKSPPRSIGLALPLFMVNTGDRGANFSLKSLEMNKFTDTPFLPLTSTFGNGWKQESPSFPIPIKGRCPKIVKVLKEKLKMT